MPPSKSMKKLSGLALIAIGTLWILNFTFGIIEPPFLMDNTPITGNLDEGAAGAMILYGFQLWLKGRKRSQPGPDQS